MVMQTKRVSLVVLSLMLLVFSASPLMAVTESYARAPKMINANDLWSLLLTSKKGIYVFDVNNNEGRVKDGLITGAKPLDQSGDWPADKNAKIVFYCNRGVCKEALQASNRAHKSGFADVSILTDGIEGWKEHKKPTDKFVDHNY